MNNDVEVMYAYEGAQTFQNPFKMFLAAASIICWYKIGLPIHIYLDKEGYDDFPGELRKFLTTIDVVDWKAYRDFFGGTQYFGFPKFVGMTKSQKPTIVSDLDVICFDFGWFDPNKNAATVFDTDQVTQSEFNRLKNVFEEYEGRRININGGFYYIRDKKIVRGLGRDLIHQCAVIERNSRPSDWWVTLDEALIRPCLQSYGEDFLITDLNSYHFHVSTKQKSTGSFPHEGDWKQYMERTIEEIKEKISEETWSSIAPWADSCLCLPETDKLFEL